MQKVIELQDNPSVGLKRVGRKSKGLIITVVAMALALLLAIGFIISQQTKNARQLTEISRLQSEIDTLNTDLTKVKALSERHRKTIKETKTELREKTDEVSAFRGKVAFVTETGEKYHRYNCFHLLGAKTEIVLVNSDTRRYYEPCADCISDRVFPALRDYGTVNKNIE